MSRIFQAVPLWILAFALVALNVSGVTKTLTGAVSPYSIQLVEASYPSQSLYALDAGLEIASGTRTTLAELGGTPRIASLFYGHCASMCPVALRTLQKLD